MEEVFKKADNSDEINVDGENLRNLRFANNVAVFNNNNKIWKKNPKCEKKTPLKQSELKKSESWPKNTQGREEKKMTNHADSEDILIYQKKKPWKSDKIQEPRTNHTPQDTTKEEICARTRAAWCWKTR